MDTVKAVRIDLPIGIDQGHTDAGRAAEVLTMNSREVHDIVDTESDEFTGIGDSVAIAGFPDLQASQFLALNLSVLVMIEVKGKLLVTVGEDILAGQIGVTHQLDAAGDLAVTIDVPDKKTISTGGIPGFGPLVLVCIAREKPESPCCGVELDFAHELAVAVSEFEPLACCAAASEPIGTQLHA